MLKRTNTFYIGWLRAKHHSWTLIPTIKVDCFEVSFRWLKLKVAYMHHDIDDNYYIPY
jgi:hypothetical protein